MDQTSKDIPDVTILGGGIIGICCALSCQELGLSVAIVDRDDPGQATSYGNAGVVSGWSFVPQCLPGVWKQVPGWLLDPKGPVRFRVGVLPRLLPWATTFFRNARASRVSEIADAMHMLMQDNVINYRRFLSGTGHENLLRDSWYVNVFRQNDIPTFDDLSWRLRVERGAPVEIVDGNQLREIEPALSPDYESAIIIKDQARVLAPGRLCEVLVDKARRQGASIVRAEVLRIEPREDGGPVLHTSDGELATRKVLLCGGIWSAELLKSVGVKTQLIAERGYHLEFSDPGVEVNNSIMDVAGKFVVSSMEGGVRSAGTSEFSPVDAAPNFKRAEILAPLTKRLLPNLNTESNKQWMGIRPSFPDNLPAIGPIKGINNLFGAFGHSHYGLGMAPATGRIVANLIRGLEPNVDMKPYALERFHS